MADAGAVGTCRAGGEGPLDKQTAVRVDLIHQRTHFNDWAWGYAGVPYTYSDGSTVSQRQQQNVNFVGVTYTIFTNCVNPIRKQCPGGVVSRHQRLPQRHLNGLQGAVFNSAASG